VIEPIHTSSSPDVDLKSLLRARHPDFWQQLYSRSREATEFHELLTLSRLRRKAKAVEFQNGHADYEPIRLALIGGYSLYPLHELVEHLMCAAGYSTDLFIGEFNGYASELMDPESALQAFRPQIVCVLPSEATCKYQGQLSDSRDQQEAQANNVSEQLLGMCRAFNERAGCEVLLGNFMLPDTFELGAFRARTLGSDWNFRKFVNLQLGLNAPPGVHICDLEFLACRRGAQSARDARSWYESKQLCAPNMMIDVAREITHLISSLRTTAKKVLVTDLDDTLWGGVVGDEGLKGIELGDTSPRGEAFKAFQKYLLSLTERGVLLAVCSKNDHDTALEPFWKHPEMVLKEKDIVSFKANWKPKSDNIRTIAAELGLGLDSFVFVDDNPAEIEIVRQFVPEVSTVLLGPDPSDYVRQLQDSRLFEPRNITQEDSQRTEQYRQETQRKAHLALATDMDSYLASMEMVATVNDFNSVDLPRICQLINKSNQFNLTTRRRTEAELLVLMQDPEYLGFTIRLRDRFGDHGLIAVVICQCEKLDGTPVLEIDTWLMSCRVLNRQVEEETMNEIARRALQHSITHIRGVYRPSSRNGLVRDLYRKLGFSESSPLFSEKEFVCDARNYHPFETRIKVERPIADTISGDEQASGDLRRHFLAASGANTRA
jgi:FkbH-like protein